MVKKLLIYSCKDCPFFYNPDNDPYPDIGWQLPRCKNPAVNNRILTSDDIKSIPEWCPLIDTGTN